MHVEHCSNCRERQSACIEFGGIGDMKVSKFPDSASSGHVLDDEVMDDRGSMDVITDGEHLDRNSTSIEFRELSDLSRG